MRFFNPLSGIGQMNLLVAPIAHIKRTRAAIAASGGSDGPSICVIILDATRINVAPLNQVPGAVVSLMDRTNETVIIAGKVRKWKASCSTSMCQICAGS